MRALVGDRRIKIALMIMEMQTSFANKLPFKFLCEINTMVQEYKSVVQNYFVLILLRNLMNEKKFAIMLIAKTYHF